MAMVTGAAQSAVSQEQPFAHIDDEILHLTPVTRQLDYPQFQASFGSLQSLGSQTILFHFDTVLLPAATWTDDDLDAGRRIRLENASEVRRSILPQFNRNGTLSLLLNGIGQTPLDSDTGLTEFRSNSPAVPGTFGFETETPEPGTVGLLLATLAAAGVLHRRRRHRNL